MVREGGEGYILNNTILRLRYDIDLFIINIIFVNLFVYMFIVIRFVGLIR